MKKRSVILWSFWGFATVTLSAYLAFAMVKGDRGLFLIGRTTDAHHQIELACNACHKPFGGTDALQQACVGCHGADLKAANDTHPISKFTDPRNADRVAILDARVCVTCHREHRPGITRAMAVTLPDDYCHLCHKDIAKERPSHAKLPFDGCTTSGCHNFHDNRALYEDFIEKHMGQPRTLAMPAVLKRVEKPLPAGGQTKRPLTAADADAPESAKGDVKVTTDWAASPHAKSGVNCTDCHTRTDPATRAKSWIAKPTLAECRTCHAGEAKGFVEGKHGMRLAQEMSPMTPAMARVPMRKDAHEKTLGCATCHGAHGFETKAAAVEACESCHADDHTKAYRASTHFKLWQAELAGTAPPGSGVSCATCHLPREAHTTDEGTKTVLVQHNQNVGLRPNEKMIRPVCMSCHGYEFSVDALADKKLVAANFKGDPARKIESTAWVKRRLEFRKNNPGAGKKH